MRWEGRLFVLALALLVADAFSRSFEAEFNSISRSFENSRKSSVSTSWTLELLPEAVAAGAVCLDGTPPGYYFHKGDPKRWVVHIMGGGWCVNEADCLDRSRGIVGSSKMFPPQPIWFGGVLSDDAVVNPRMHDWTFVYIAYCDGASFAGNLDDPIVVNGTKLFFRGIRILDFVFDHLLNQKGMGGASEVVVTGFSAGGLSTYLHLDHLREVIPSGIRVVGMPDAGFFLDHVDENGKLTYPDQMKYVYGMQNVSGGIDASCLAAHRGENQWQCFMAPHTVGYVTTPMFIVNHAIDTWQLTNILAPLDPKWAACVQNQTVCSIPMLNQAQNYRKDFLTSVRIGVSKPGVGPSGAFLPSCFQHLCALSDYFWSKTLINGRSMASAFWSWYVDSGGSYFSYDVPWPGNPACPHIPAP